MAEAVIEVVLHNLTSLIQKEIGLFLCFDHDFTSLSSLLTIIKATLEDAEEKQFNDRAIKDWLLKLKDTAHILDDILDECATQVLEYEGIKDRLSNKVQSSFLSCFHPKHIAFRYQIAKKMKNIRERLDEIAEERSKFHLTEIVREKRSGVPDWRQTTSIITQPQVYGRDADKDKILDFLVGHASGFEDLSVYPIVGLGGLGKTTLAQLIFNHERVVSHFDLRIWVCVSEDFSLKRMTKAIIESHGHVSQDLDLEPLQRILMDLLQRKRYLLVLDDVWDDEQENWQRLKSVLACGGKGSSILVTTRLLKVAAIMGTMPPHDLSMLSDIDCWELLKQRAFGLNEEEHEELVVIGKEIAKKCVGVPLAAMALGSLLRFKREKIEWFNVKESKLWNLQGEDYVMSVLRLSYLNLPIKLRQCFSFCALFQKDERIYKKFLIELWMANGFISSNEMLEAEDMGNEIWNELYWRSFFQDVERDEFSKVISFKMHDLVHDLAQYITKESYITIKDSGVPSKSERIRHLLICKDWEELDSIRLPTIQSLKTCISHVNQVSPRIWHCYSLRVLDFKNMNKVPSHIGSLKYLRYLNLSWGNFKTLPKSLCTLWNLQILKLDYCCSLQRLPYGLVQLKALHHLSLKGCLSLSSLPRHISKLASLKTLSMYVVGKKKGFLLAELGQMNLMGDLHIKHLERVKSVMNAKEANMLRKHVNTLELSWERNEESQLQENVEEILEVLQPQTQQLQCLSMRGYTGAYFPQWMSCPSLKYLIHIQLVDCQSCLHLPHLGKLPSLKNLIVSNMSQVKYLYEESCNGGFPAIEFFILEDLPNLVRLSREDRENMFPCLSTIQITECPVMLELPFLPSLNDLRLKGKCSQHFLSSIHKHDTLESLCFRNNEELNFFPDGMLRDLTCLKNLDICGLSKLEQLPDEVLHGLRSLKKLSIVRCQKFNLSESFQYLTCLEEMIIQSCPEIEGLHEALQHMIALQSLSLSDLPNLAFLPDWLGNLGLLHSLIISLCPKLTCLPISIQRLTNLKGLEIYSCSELGKRCKVNTGEDWHKIAHIQNIQVKNQSQVFFKARGCFASNPYGFHYENGVTYNKQMQFQLQCN